MPESDWVKVAEMKELARRRKLRVSVAGEEIALFFDGDQVYALRDTCLHKERSLSKGTLLNGRVICPGHQWAYDLATGWEAEVELCQPTYAVKVTGDDILVVPTQRVLVTESTDV